MDTITTIQSLLTFNGSAQSVTVSLTENERRLIAQAPAMLRELERMVEHFSVFASDHSMDASTETWAALHCAKEVIAAASGEAP